MRYLAHSNRICECFQMACHSPDLSLSKRRIREKKEKNHHEYKMRNLARWKALSVMNVFTKDSPSYGGGVRRGLPNTWKSRARKEGDYKKEMLRIGKLAQKLLDEEYHGKKETSKLFEQERFWVAVHDIRFSP